MNATKLSPEIISEFVDWEEDKNPTPDEIIDAFKKGVEKAKSAQEKAITDAHIANLEKTMDISESAFSKLNEMGMECSKIFVNASNFGKYDVILAVNKAPFLTEKRKKAYQFLRDVRKKENNLSYNLYFSLMPLGDSIDNEALSADGFIIRYEPK